MGRARELVVFSFIDPPEVLDAVVTPIPGKASPPMQIVASLSRTVYAICIQNGVGTDFLALYRGPVGQEKLICGTGVAGVYREDVFIPKGTRISIRSLSPVVINTGAIFIQFSGES